MSAFVAPSCPHGALWLPTEDMCGRKCGGIRFDYPRRRPRVRACSADDESSAGEGAGNRAGERAGNHGLGFVIWGPPGCGKTSVCEELSRRYGLVHVATGDLLRAHVLYRTELGLRASKYVENGTPVPDGIVIPMMLERLGKSDCVHQGFVLDGFPRSVEQAAALRAEGLECRQAFIMHAPREVLESRLKHRRLDPETQEIYNIETRRPISQEVLERLTVLRKDKGRNIADLLAKYGRVAADMFDKLQPNFVSVDADRPLENIVSEIGLTLQSEGIKTISEAPRVSVAPQHTYSRKTKADETAVQERSPPVAQGMSVSEKSPITLIRCDGYMCERESVDGSKIAFRGAATEQVMLIWNRKLSTVLLLAKKGPELMPSVLEAARYLKETQDIRVIVEQHVQTEALANGLYLQSFSSRDVLHNEVDLVVCLGGDGLILHVSTLFDTSVPPVLSFNLGSLGFLTPFDYTNFRKEMSNVLRGNCLLSLRMRLTCSIIRNGAVAKEFSVLNEVVIDRGASPYLSNLDCFCDGKYITTVQADGVIMSTPTGSTAYSMSAGGSMVHPSVPAILFTPICPHSLSFRPIIFPDSAKIRIDIARDARSHAWASFDGKYRQQLRRGDGLVVQMSLYPVPTINKTDHTGDWFQSLDRAFNFNSRAMQKPLSSQDEKAKNGAAESSADSGKANWNHTDANERSSRSTF